MAKGRIEINVELCKACGQCIVFCKEGCIEEGRTINAKGYMAVVFAHPEKCNGCAVCGQMCPDVAIDIYRFK